MTTRNVTEHTPLETVVEVVRGTHAGRFGRLVRYGEGLCQVRLWSVDLKRWERGREYVGILRKNLATTTYRVARDRAELLMEIECGYREAELQTHPQRTVRRLSLQDGRRGLSPAGAG